MNGHSKLLSDKIKAEIFKLEEDSYFPNNKTLPVLLYKKVLNPASENLSKQFESLISSNHWSGAWRNGIYTYHHYHSNAHEVLAVYSGSVTVQLGGPNGKIVELLAGDVVILPAGAAHKQLSSSDDFGVIGAYPEVQERYDMNYGGKGERPGTDRNIERVPLPVADPIYGDDGPLMKYWRSK